MSPTSIKETVAHARPIKLLAGQAVLYWVGGAWRLGSVGNSGESGTAVLSSTPADTSTVELSFDACFHAVLPWRTPAEDTAKSLIVDTQLLATLGRHVSASSNASATSSPDAVAKAMMADLEHVRTVWLRDRVAASLKEVLEHMVAAVAARLMLEKSRAAGSAPLAAVELLRLKAQSQFDTLQAFRAAVEPVRLEGLAVEALLVSGSVGRRCYGMGQALAVLQPGDGTWIDVEVLSSLPGGTHSLKRLGGAALPPLRLHPWNHAPMLLPAAAFKAQWEQYAVAVCSEHEFLTDGLSGRRLDVRQQCVPIAHVEIAADRVGEAGLTPPTLISDVHGLCDWLHWAYAKRRQPDGHSGNGMVPTAGLLTAGPAAGKTCLMSQLLVATIERKGGAQLVPILIRVQLLQRRLLASEGVFAASWNWVS